MAMGTLASGYLRPDDAYAYLGGQPGIESVVVGVSSAAHIEETFAAIRMHGIGSAPATTGAP
jgi:aryl-alcohol dehydrogenase-like predicted oxidoreductase